MISRHPEYLGYFVDDKGIVLSCWTKGGKLLPLIQAKPLKTDVIKGGYLRVTIRTTKRKYVRRLVSHLVLEAFCGPRPDGLVACHRDGNPKNNQRWNLRWDTRKANEEDKRLVGTHQTGEGNPAAKLNDTKIRDIRLARARGDSTYKIARNFNISRPVVAKIVKGLLWRHVV